MQPAYSAYREDRLCLKHIIINYTVQLKNEFHDHIAYRSKFPVTNMEYNTS